MYALTYMLEAAHIAAFTHDLIHKMSDYHSSSVIDGVFFCIFFDLVNLLY